jgi:hypothetical protein
VFRPRVADVFSFDNITPKADNRRRTPSISSKPSSVKILRTSQPSTSPEHSGSMILITASPSISPAPISYSKVTGCSSHKYPHFISNDKLCTFNSRDHWKQ